MAKQRGGLGRGLASLFDTNDARTTNVVDDQIKKEDKIANTETPTLEVAVTDEDIKNVTNNGDVSRETPLLTEVSSEINRVQKTVESQDKLPVSRETESFKDEVEDNISDESTSTKTTKQDDDNNQIAFEISIDKIEPNPDQPRTRFKTAELDELADSIKKDGLINPIVVRKVGKKYQIVAGERRWQASKKAGIKKVLVHLVEADDNKSLELALIENLQRSDLNPIEEAYGYKRLMERTQKSQTQIAEVVSKGRSTITNALRLLDLPEKAQKLLFENKITAGHARAILSIPTPEGREKLTDKLLEQKLSVREAENLARLISGRQNKGELKTRVPLPEVYVSTAKRLSSHLDTKVKVKSSARGSNKLEIEFKDADDLARIVSNMRSLEDSQEG